MLTLEELSKWASLTGERARSEAKVFKSSITYMDDKGRIVTEYYDGRIEVNKEAEKKSLWVNNPSGEAHIT